MDVSCFEAKNARVLSIEPVLLIFVSVDAIVVTGTEIMLSRYRARVQNVKRRFEQGTELR